VFSRECNLVQQRVQFKGYQAISFPSYNLTLVYIHLIVAVVLLLPRICGAAMGCEIWARIQRRAESAIEDLARHQKSLPKLDRKREQIARMRKLQNAAFEAIAAMQRHEKEHGCHNSAEFVSKEARMT